jgi:hypothetical protein
MLRNSHCAATFHRSPPAIQPMGRPTASAAAAFRRIAATLRALRDAWRESLASHRAYEHLRSRGIPHDTALRESLGIGPSPARAPREMAKPLYLAGKA